MGIWGPKLYEDDLALDIKEDYIEKIENGVTTKKALEEIKAMYAESIEDTDESPIFWMTLADTMWELGNLTEEVKNKAIEEIEKGNNLKLWKEEADENVYKTREKELEKLKEKLNSKMPTKKKILTKEKAQIKKKNDWDIGDIYAYKLKSDWAKKMGIYGRYIVLRKTEPENPTGKRINAVSYCQITKTNELPKTQEELEKLEYIITKNEGNVRYCYRIRIPNITQKQLKEEMIYIGNFQYVKTPEKEYREVYKENIPLCFYKELEEFSLKNIYTWFGTSHNPKYKEQDPRNILDSQIRFLMREKYYEEMLGIQPQKGSLIQEDALLYISLIDSMMIGGFVRNPVGPLTDEMKEKAYVKIKELKEIIANKNENKEAKIKVLEDLEQKIREYEHKDLFAEFMKKTQE